MKSMYLASIAFVAGLFGAQSVMADTTVYPSAEHPSFLVDHPSNWTLEPGEEVGDYMTLTGPTGVVVQFRTIPGSESAIDDALEDTRAYLESTFTDVVLGDSETTKHRGLDLFMVSGAGLDDEGAAVGFTIAFLALKDGHIAELWFAVTDGDDEGAAAAEQVLNSFRAP